MRSRRFLIPEVVQTSAMDCGPASLKCLLEGHGIHVNYARLREACQTDVDGTSINAIEDAANQLGLEAEQVMLPVEHLFVDSAKTIPAIVVMRLPNSWTHFVVVWGKFGRWYQIMDPATGRVWKQASRFGSELYVHTMDVPADSWRSWVGSEEFLRPLRERMRQLGIDAELAERSISEGVADASWKGLATVDAAVRAVTALCANRAVRRGAEATRTLTHLLARPDSIPPTFWCVSPSAQAANGSEQLRFRGAVLVRALRPSTGEKHAAASADLRAALESPASTSALSLFHILRTDGYANIGLLLATWFLQAAIITGEVLLFRAFFGASTHVKDFVGRLQVMGGVVAFTLVAFICGLPGTAAVLRYGRIIESRLRIAFLSKLPLIGDRYFQSRLTSDMAERSHSVASLRALPGLASQIIGSVFELIMTAGAIVWLDPSLALPAAVVCLLVLGIPLTAQTLLAERDLRLRTHNGALTRFYLDSMIGLTAIRAHSAENAVRVEQERLLSEWVRAALGFARSAVAVEAIQTAVCTGASAWMLLHHLLRGGDPGGALLLLYWTMNLPVIAATLSAAARQYPIYRNVVLRLFEPLSAAETEGTIDVRERADREEPGGVAIELENVTVMTAGHTILSRINLSISEGERVAVVGPSGAGKSTLVGLLLGWYVPSGGSITADGMPLTAPALASLRQRTSWIDPSIHIWNRTLLHNLMYGASGVPDDFGALLERSDLLPLLDSMPDGLQTKLGEGGGLVSGGEGQRVRLGRAMNRNARLVILDEAFRGLDHRKRTELLQRACSHWPAATILCVTHDVADTLEFERVIVIDGGRLAEDGSPAELRKDAGTLYSQLLQRDSHAHRTLWSSDYWRRFRTDRGGLVEG